MLLDKLLLQMPVAAPDTVAANKIKEATHVVTAQVDSLANQLHEFTRGAMNSGNAFKNIAGVFYKVLAK
jgi:hypothetical protein